MSETKAGNIEAIRDWSKRYFYTKSDVSEFFTKLNTGLTAYKLTIIGPANTTVNITENASTNPQTYVIKTQSNGIYTGLFFFHSGSTLNLSAGSYSATHVLSNYVDIISLVSLIIATPIMTSATTPSGEVITDNQYDANYAAWRAFKQEIDNNGWVTKSTGLPAYIGFHFTQPIVIVKILTNNRNYNGTAAQIGAPTKFYFQGSNDGTNWTDIQYCEATNLAYAAQNEYYIINDTAYSYYRLYIIESSGGTVSCALSRLNMYKPDI